MRQTDIKFTVVLFSTDWYQVYSSFFHSNSSCIIGWNITLFQWYLFKFKWTCQYYDFYSPFSVSPNKFFFFNHYLCLSLSCRLAVADILMTIIEVSIFLLMENWKIKFTLLSLLSLFPLPPPMSLILFTDSTDLCMKKKQWLVHADQMSCVAI